MSEQEADLVMEHVMALESNPFSTINTAMLKHLCEMHRLRDARVYHSILYDDGYMTLWPELDAMQPF